MNLDQEPLHLHWEESLVRFIHRGWVVGLGVECGGGVGVGVGFGV